MAISLRTYHDHVTRKGDPIDPRGLSAQQLAGLLSGDPAAIERIEAHMSEHPRLWNLDPAELMRELTRLPGVGKGLSAWWVLNELQVGRRVQEHAPVEPE